MKKELTWFLRNNNHRWCKARACT